MLAIRAGDFIPTGVRFVQYDDLGFLRILTENPVIRTRAGAQAQRIALGGHLVDQDVVNGGLVLLGDKAHLRGHGSGHRRSEDTSFSEACPFAIHINGVDERQLPLSVQGFRNSAGLGNDDAQTVVGEIFAVCRIDANQRQSPPEGIKKAPQRRRRVYCFGLEV